MIPHGLSGTLRTMSPCPTVVIPSSSLAGMVVIGSQDYRQYEQAKAGKGKTEENILGCGGWQGSMRGQRSTSSAGAPSPEGPEQRMVTVGSLQEKQNSSSL